MKHRWLWTIVLLVAVTGCRDKASIPEKVDKLGRATGPVLPALPPHPSPPPSAPSRAATPTPTETIAGTVLESIDASRYTYIHIQTKEDGAVWAAVPQVQLNTGEAVEVIQSLVMENFESKTLKRVFPKVIFGVLTRQATAAETKQ